MQWVVRQFLQLLKVNRFGGNYCSGSADDAGFLMSNADSVVIVPGYGMAQGRAQNAVKRVMRNSKRARCSRPFRNSPGCRSYAWSHERVLLAEADVAYEEHLEMDEINSDFPATDVEITCYWCKRRCEPLLQKMTQVHQFMVCRFLKHIKHVQSW